MRVNVEYDWYSLVEKSYLSSLLYIFVVVLFKDKETQDFLL